MPFMFTHITLGSFPHSLHCFVWYGFCSTRSHRFLTFRTPRITLNQTHHASAGLLRKCTFKMHQHATPCNFYQDGSKEYQHTQCSLLILVVKLSVLGNALRWVWSPGWCLYFGESLTGLNRLRSSDESCETHAWVLISERQRALSQLSFSRSAPTWWNVKRPRACWNAHEHVGLKMGWGQAHCWHIAVLKSRVQYVKVTVWKIISGFPFCRLPLQRCVLSYYPQPSVAIAIHQGASSPGF